jgi:hypothetical protein
MGLRGLRRPPGSAARQLRLKQIAIPRRASAAGSRGMELTMMVEHDSVPWEALPGQMEQTGTLGGWRLIDRPWRLPHSYTLQARKRT